MPNRLAAELSPYLLQHAENPVDWFPWGDEAFTRARTEDRPIFLSVGYSTCHWCHVMEHESFENGDVAAVLNRFFVPVKVDREERPDVDRVYMAFVQATTGAGGWPMSVWLTPDLQPFYGGTYFPPTSRYGRPGFVEVLTRMASLWKDERERLVRSASEILTRLRDIQSETPPGGRSTSVPPASALAEGAGQFVQAFDEEHAGFGGAPKFPRPAELIFLLREHARTGDRRLLELVVRTLRAMTDGGMHDHLGGGFHRYAVDAAWRIPHFEKMLYDQAQLLVALVEAGRAAGEPRLLEVAIRTIDYVARDLTAPEGGFFSAEDADSLPPDQAGDPEATPREGAFYLWDHAELTARLGDDAALFARRYGVAPQGNAPSDPTGELAGLNQLYLACDVEQAARGAGVDPVDAEARLASAVATLLSVREGRPRPHLDDKILAAWNGLMIGAVARAAFVLDLERAEALAERAAGFAQRALWDEGRGVLRRRYRDGQAAVDGYCEDYAYLIWGLLELFQTTGSAHWLEWARRLQSRQDALFWDETAGGWFSTTGRDPSVLLRMKDDYDGAEPSAGSVSVHNLLTLQHLVPDEAARRRVDATLGRVGAGLARGARVVPLMAAALATRHAGLDQVVVVGPRRREDTMALHRAVAERFLPFVVRVPVEPGAPQAALGTTLPFVSAMTMVEGRATAYVCRDFACQAPVTEPEGLAVALDERQGERRGVR